MWACSKCGDHRGVGLCHMCKQITENKMEDVYVEMSLEDINKMRTCLFGPFIPRYRYNSSIVKENEKGMIYMGDTRVHFLEAPKPVDDPKPIESMYIQNIKQRAKELNNLLGML